MTRIGFVVALMLISYSTKYFMTDLSDLPSMMPDVLIEVTAADLFAGRDPVFEAALAHR